MSFVAGVIFISDLIRKLCPRPDPPEPEGILFRLNLETLEMELLK
jgi:hypothetical protein